MSGDVKYFTIEKFSHCFVITHHTPRGHQIVMEFAANYAQMGMVKVGRQWKREIVKIFAARCPTKRQVRFHHGQWKEFQAYLSGLGLKEEAYTLLEYSHYDSDAVELKIADGWAPRDYQEPIIEYLSSPEPSPIKLLQIQTGKGKAHPNDEAVKTPNGWTTIGSLKPGDYVIDESGHKVAVDEVYPQGSIPTYKIDYTDGRLGHSSLDHLWSVVVQKPSGFLSPEVVSLKDIITLMAMPGVRVFTPLAGPIMGLNEDVPFDAWTLGAIIASGYFARGPNDTGEYFRLILKNEYVINRLETELPKYGYKLTADGRHAFKLESVDVAWIDSKLRELLSNGDAYIRRNKRAYIPKAYFESTIGIRQSLVSGMMDASGAVDKQNRLVFKTHDENLSDDFTYLVRSLGDKTHVRLIKGKFTHVIHTLEVRNYFETEAYIEKALDQIITMTTRLIEIDRVSYAGDTPSTCISIDGDQGLYVISDFILTHNTYCAAEAIAKNGKRFIVFLKPQFIDKWRADLKKLMDFTDEDIAVVQGSASMMNLIAQAMSGNIPYKAIIVSNKTFQNWITAYEEEGDALLQKGYDCHPDQLMQVLRVGLRLVDEVHMDFHLNFKIDLYTHVAKSISLSATLISDDPFISTMQLTAYPKYLRYAGMEYDKYVHSVAILYSLKPNTKVETTERGSSKYSHHAVEKSLYRSPALMASYLALIEKLFRKYHVQRDGIVKGDRCLLYVSSIQFATTLTDYLILKHPTYDIRRYVEDDPYENLMDGEITVSTIGSAGTGHDIDLLATVILTTAVRASASNIQGFGRLRNLAGKQMLFLYLTCEDIPKHVEYHDKKDILLLGMAKKKEVQKELTLIG